MNTQTVQIIKNITKDDAMIVENVNNGATEQYLFVASKKGKYYYPKNCSRAKALSIQNVLYFKDILSAEAAGFKAFSGC